MAIAVPERSITMADYDVMNLAGQIAELDARERELSSRRGSLHRAIDRLYLTSPLNAEGIAHLDELEAFERDVSAQRRQLHVELDALRARAGMPRWRAEHAHAA